VSITLPERVAAARKGTNSAVICQVPSGWAVLADMQFLHGYTILLADPVVPSINDLDRSKRAEYLFDMALIGDALLEVTGAFRINYGILGNSDPFLHAHIVPRYLNEPKKYRRGLPWSYPRKLMDGLAFDYERDKDLLQRIAASIQKHL
jgi:diadenosine tetraphosphate (Ap4A) HIT family hydrolase